MANTSALVLNNVSASLFADLSDTDTELVLYPSQGASFPQPDEGEYFFVTLANGSGTSVEIVKVTARSTDTLTIVRAQDGTTAKAFVVDNKVEMRPIAQHFREKADEQAVTSAITDINNDISALEAVVATKTPLNQTVETRSGNYTLVLSDSGKFLVVGGAGAVVLTVPANSTVAFPIGASIDFVRAEGPTSLTVAGAGGVSVNSTPAANLRATNSAATLIKTAENVWYLVGDLQ